MIQLKHGRFLAVVFHWAAIYGYLVKAPAPPESHSSAYEFHGSWLQGMQIWRHWLFFVTAKPAIPRQSAVQYSGSRELSYSSDLTLLGLDWYLGQRADLSQWG